MSNSKTFRLFISSPFSDFEKEREVLHKKVFPEIEKHCNNNHLTFQPVDLRWGVNEEAQLDQKTLEVCLEEVRACKQFPHPNFLIMAGDRYGYVPCPYMIGEGEYEKIKQYVKENDEQITITYKEYDDENKKKHQKDSTTPTKLELLEKWYLLDKNQIYTIDDKNTSAAYILQIRDNDYKRYVNWEAEEIALREILQEAANCNFKSEKEKENKEYLKYFQSATEQEVLEGICDYKEKTEAQEGCNGGIDKKYVFGYIRTIENAHGGYIDNAKNKEAVDKLKLKAKQFKDDLQNILEKSNILEKELSTFKSIKDYEESRLLKFEEYIIEKLKDSISKQIPDNKKLSREEKKKINLAEEILEQQKFLKDKIKGFQGRKKTLDIIENYLKEKDTTEPLIIHGLSGMGKSSLMAKAIEETKGNNKVFRFVGATANSTTIRNLLISIVDELQDKNIIEKVEEYEVDNNKFDTQIKVILLSIKEESTIFIDALDQLQNINYLNWLPDVLPLKLKIILSVLNDKKYDDEHRKEGTHYYSRLNQIYTNKDGFIDITKDSLEECEDSLIEKLLETEHRKLNKTQTKYLKDKWAKTNYSPLYLKIAIEEVKHWKHCEDTKEEPTLCEKQKLNDGIEGIISEYLKNLDDLYHHEQLLVKKVFGYIHASKDGLSERELLHILSEDLEDDKKFRKTIINEYHKAIKVNNPRNDNKEDEHILPISIWSRLHTQIKPFIVERNIDNQPLMKFFHRQFTSVVEDSYKEEKEELHAKLASYFLSLQDKSITKTWDKRYHNLHMLDELPYQLFYSNNPEGLKDILFDIEFAGCIYDNHKQDKFREILEQSIQLDGISNNDIYPWESFYREKEHFILETTEGEWEPHQILFQLTYEDGVDSSCHNTAKQLINGDKIYWEWFQKLNLDESLTREVEYVYNSKIDNIEIDENFNCIILDDYFIFYYDKAIYIFSNKLKFIKKLDSENTLNYFKSITYDRNLYIFFENELLIIAREKYRLVNNYLEKIVKNIPKDMKIKSVFYKSEIYYLVALANSSFERMCYDYEVIKNDSGDYSKVDYEAMIIDKAEGIKKLFVLTEDFTIQKIVEMNSVEKYVKIITSDNGSIYYRKDDKYYLYDKKDKAYRLDNKPPEDKVDYYAEVDLDDECLLEEMNDKDYYTSLHEGEAWDLGEYEYNKWREYNDPNFNIESKTVKLASGEKCEKVELLNYSSYAYNIKNGKYLSIFEQYIFIIDAGNRKTDKEYFFVEKYMNQYFNKSEDSEIYLIDEESYILKKENRLQIFSKNTVIYDCNKEIHSFYIYDNILVLLLEDKQTILQIDVSHMDNLKIQTIDLTIIKNIEWQEKDKINRVIVATSGKIAIEYSRYIVENEEGWHQISEDEYEPYHEVRTHWEKRIYFIEKINDNYEIAQDIYFAYINEDGETADYLFAIDDSEENYLIYNVHVDSEEGYSFRLNDKSIHTIEEKSTKFNFEWNTFYAKKRLIVSGKYNDLKVYDQCSFSSVEIEKNHIKFLDENNNLIYYTGDFKELKFFHDKIITFDGSNIDVMQLKN